MKLYIPSILLLSASIFFGQAVANNCNCLTKRDRAVLDHLSMENLIGCNGTRRPALRVTGANFQVVNGMNSTDTVNGLGNVLVGYGPFGDGCATVGDDCGSHNIVYGIDNAFSSYGGLVGGEHNYIAAPLSSILGGFCNRTNGISSTILSGTRNVTDGLYSAVVGGFQNKAMGNNFSVVVGGRENTANNSSVIVGGEGNFANSENGVAVGGENNNLIGNHCVTVGGEANIGDGRDNVVVGGLFNDSDGAAAHAVLSGGRARSVFGDEDWVAGTLFEDN